MRTSLAGLESPQSTAPHTARQQCETRRGSQPGQGVENFIPLSDQTFFRQKEQALLIFFLKWEFKVDAISL